MTFLAPLFLLGLAALSIPILLHLLRRRENRTLDFPALRYLARTTREQARIIRLRQILLLALRLTALLLLVLAAARWVLPLGGRDYPPGGVVLVIDNGLTSGRVVGSSRILDTLLERAAEALDRVGAQDLIWVLPAGEPWLPVLPLTPDEARQRLTEVEPTQVRARIGAALDRAASLLDAGAPEELREILLFSDLRPESLADLEIDGEERPETVRIAPPPPATSPNRGIQEVLISGGLTPRAGESGEILVRIAGEELEGTQLRVYIGELLVGATSTGAEGLALLPLPTILPGWTVGRVEIDPDDLRGDDVGVFAFRAVPPPPVETVGVLSPFLLDALAVLEEGGRIRSGGGSGAALRIVGIGGATPIPSPVPTLLLPPDDPASLPALNRILEILAPGWRVEAAPGGVGEREVVGGSLLPLLPPLPRVRVAHRIRAAEGTTPGTPLLTLAGGDPWLLRIEGAGGPVLLLASPLTLAASELPASAAMLPLVDLLTNLGSGELRAGGIHTGDPLPLPTPGGTGTIRLPDGTVRPFPGTSTFPETGTVGVYAVLGPGAGDTTLVAVNPRAPAPGPPLDAEAAALRIGTLWPDAAAADPWPESVLAGRRGREVGRPLALALLLVLVAEGWLAAYGGRGGKRKDAP